MKKKKLVSLKIGEMRIDIYDYAALDYMLEWMIKLAVSSSPDSNQDNAINNGAMKNIKIRENTEPSFLRDNPWIGVLLKRGKE